MTIYVGNLNYRTEEQELNNLFSEYGAVGSVQIIKDKFSGRSKGFAFVEMEDETAAQKAIDALNDQDFMERKLAVNKARPKTEGDRPQRSFNRDRGGDRGGYNRDRGGY